MKEYIRREIYKEKVRPFIGKDIIKVIVSQRRTGKAYFLFQVMDLLKTINPETNILYINKEDLEYDVIKTYTYLVTYAENHADEKCTNTIFIDEIQEIEEFERALRHLHTTGKWDIYCTGSKANLIKPMRNNVSIAHCSLYLTAVPMHRDVKTLICELANQRIC